MPVLSRVIFTKNGGFSCFFQPVPVIFHNSVPKTVQSARCAAQNAPRTRGLQGVFKSVDIAHNFLRRYIQPFGMRKQTL